MKSLRITLQITFILFFIQTVKAQNTLYMNPIKYTDRNINSYNDNCGDATKIHYLVNNVEISRTTRFYCCGFHSFSIDYGLIKPGDVFKVTQDCSPITYSQVVKDDYIYVEVPNGLSYTGNGITATDETAPYTKLSTPVSVGKCETINVNAHGLSEYFVAYYPPNTGLTTGIFSVNSAPLASGATVVSPAGHSISSQGTPNVTSTVNANGSITSNGSFKLTSNTALSGTTPINMEYQHNGISVGGDFAFGFGAMFFAGISNTGFKVVKYSTAGVQTEILLSGNYTNSLFKITYDGTYYRAYVDGVKIDELRRFVKYGSSSGTLSNTGVLDYGTGVTWTPSSSGTQWVSVEVDGVLYTRQQFTVADDMILTGSTTNVACSGGSTGAISTTITGGKTPITYSINGGGYSTISSFPGLGANNYTVRAKDASGCIVSRTFSITENPVLSLTATQTNVLCTGGSDGSVNLSATGGTGVYTYSKDGTNYVTSSNFGSLNEGAKTFYVKDGAGCIKTIALTITAQSKILATVSSQSNVLCFGGNTGSVTLNTTGSVPNGTLQFSSGGAFSTDNPLTGLIAQAYTITVKDNLCQVTIPVTITQPSDLVISPVINNQISCNGLTDGKITVGVTGGTGAYQYSQDNITFVSSPTFNNLGANGYKFWVKDANSCTKNSSIYTIVEPPAIVFSVASKVDVVCNGSNTGSITLTTSGGTSPFSYSKDGTNFQASNVFTGLTAQSYTLTVKDANGCTKTIATSIIEPTLIVLSSSISKTISCQAGNDGEVTLSATGGSGTYQYSKDNVNYTTSGVFAGLNTGNYTFYVRDATNPTCVKSISFNLAEPALLVPAVASQSNVLCKNGTDGTVNLSASGGTSPYQYSKDGTNYQATVNFTGFAAGTYTFSVKDAKGCVKTVNTTITQPSILGASATTTQQVGCFGGTNGIIQVSGSGGTSPYQYSNNGTAYVTNNNFSGLAQGSYSFWVKDNNGCVQTTTNTAVTQPTDIVFSVASKVDVVCNGSNTGSITLAALGGTSPFTYSKDGSNFQVSNVFTGLTAQSYTLTVKDANGCTKTVATSIVEPTLIVLSSSISKTISCQAGNDGEVTLSATGGSGTYQYSKDNANYTTSGVFAGLNTGNYTFYVRDAANPSCVKSISLNLAEPTLLVPAVASQTNVLCKNGTDGTVNLSASGGTSPYQYSKDGTNYQATVNFTGFPVGTYTFSVKDAKGCVKTINATITEPTLLGATAITTQQVSCFGGANGIIQVSGSGGTSPYQYSNNGTAYVTSNNFTGLAQGSYSFWVKDNNGCVQTTTNTAVTQPTDIVFSVASKVDVVCNGSNTGSITLATSGGTPNFTYSKDGTNFQASNVFTGLTAQSYTLTVKDANGCTKTVATSIVQPTLIVLSSSISKTISCQADNDGEITLSATGGSGTYQYSKDNANYVASGVFAGLNTGNYTFYVRDAANPTCIKSITLNVTEPTLLVPAVASQTNVLCKNGTDGTVNLSASGGTSPYQYSKDGTNYQATVGFTGFAVGTYTFSVKDAKGCVKTINATITEPTILGATATTTQQVNCFGGANGIIQVSGSGGTSPYQYSNNGTAYVTNNNFTGLAQGSYSFWVKDNNGCVQTTTNTAVTQPTDIIITLQSKSDVKCFSGNDGTFTLTASGGTGTLSFSKDAVNYQASATFSSLTAQTYTVSVKDQNTCVRTLSVQILQPAAFAINSVSNQALSCFGNATGRIEVAGSGGTLPYQYSINNSTFQTSAVFAGLGAGNYTVYAKDANNCTFSLANNIINQPTDIAISLLQKIDVDCEYYQKGGFTVGASGGVGAFTYNLSGQDFKFNPIAGSSNGTGVFNQLFAGNYVVNVQDITGCSRNFPVTIVPKNSRITFNISKTLPTNCTTNDGSLTINSVGGGINPYQYRISSQNTFSSNNVFNNLGNGSYIITVADGLCSYNQSVDLSLPNSLKATYTLSPISCAVPNGNLTVNSITGGNGNYALAIDGATFSANTVYQNLVPNVYALTIKDSPLSCQSIVSFELKEQNRADLTLISKVDILCNGANTGIIQVAGNNNLGPFQYGINQKNTFTTNGNFTNLTAGTYKTYARTSFGCIDSLQVSLSQPSAVQGFVSKTDNNCFGDNSGTISASASGGISPYTYATDGTNFGTSGAFSNLTANNYTVSIKDANGCILPKSITLNQPSLLVPSTSTGQNVSCFSGADGSVIVGVSGGSSPYQYSSDGTNYTTNNTFGGLVSNSYTYFVKDVKGCTKQTASIVISQPTLLVPSITSKIDLSCFAGSDGQILMSATGGTSPYQYASNQSTYQTAPNLTGLSVGTYTVSVKDAKGCIKTLSQVLTQPQDLAPVLSVTQNVSCFGGNDGQVSVANTGGTSPYQYSNDGITYGNNNVFGTLTAQNYSYWVKDSKGCTKQSAAIGVSQPTLLVPTVLTQVDVSCFSGTDGSVTLQANGGTSPYQYSKDGTTFLTTTAFTGFNQGAYTFTVKDAKNCVKTLSVTVAQPTILVAGSSVTKNVLCFGGNTGEMQVSGTGGTSPYQYSSDGTSYLTNSVFTSLIANPYTYFIKDAKGCIKQTTAQTVTQPTDVVPSITSFINVSCNGGSDGIISSAATGGVSPYQFSIGTGAFQTTGSFNNLLFGTYAVNIKDVNGCTKTLSQTLTQPAASIANVNVTQNVSCFGGNDGIITVTASGGTSPYQYSDGAAFQPSNIFNGLTAQNNYQYSVKDALGCIQRTATIGISEPTLLVPIIASQTNVFCFGGNNASINLSASGGTSPYQYSQGGVTYQATALFSGFTLGTYSFSVKDGKGCVKTINGIITQPSDLLASSAVTKNVLCFEGNTGEIQVAGNGGTSPYQYSSDGTSYLSSNIFTDLRANTYRYFVKDALGCVKQTTEKAVSQPTLLVPSVTTSSDVKCFGGNDGTITLTATGGVSPYQYSSELANFNTIPTLQGFAIGNYTLYVKDANGCVKTTTQTLNQPTVLEVSAQVTKNVSCFEGNDGEIFVTAKGGTSPYRYSGVDGNFMENALFTKLTAKNFKFIIKDANGCLKPTLELGISQPPLLVPALISQGDVSCFGGSDGKINAAASGGTAPYQYSINDRFSDQGTFENLRQQAYSLSVKDAKNCVQKLPVKIIEPDLLTLKAFYQDTIACFGDAKGSVLMTAQGGNTNYLFSKDDKNYFTETNFKDLTAGAYTFYVKDNKLCKTQTDLQITQPDLLALKLIQQVNPSCAGDENGRIEVLSAGGNGSYIYTLDNVINQNQGLFEKLTQSEYALKVVDKKGCKQNISPVKLIWPKALNVSADVGFPKCVGDANGTVTLNANGGTLPYTASVNTNTPVVFNDKITINDLKSGKYPFTLTDVNGCRISLPITLPEAEPLNNITFDAPKEVCKGQTVTLDANNPKQTIEWLFEGNFLSKAPKIAVDKPGLYAVSVKNATGCEVKAAYKLVNNANALKADFILPTQAFIGDTIVALDVSKPIPTSIIWILPNEMFVVRQNNSRALFIPSIAGDKTIGMIAKSGECQNIVFRNITIFEAGNSDGTDDAYNYKSEIITDAVIYPNPNKGIFNLKITLKKPLPIQAKMYYLSTGELVYAQTLQPKTTDLNAVHNHPFNLELSVGIYSLYLEVGTQKIYKRIIITE